MENNWPFDARQDDPLAALRIPVTCFNPGWRYIAAFDYESERPTDLEAKMIASYIESYKEYWYNESFKRKLMERPLDVDGGCNTIVFKKYAENDWAYRRCSWQYGPLYVPLHPNFKDRALGPLTLLQVMDRDRQGLKGDLPHWAKWKADHPEIFGKAEAK